MSNRKLFVLLAIPIAVLSVIYASMIWVGWGPSNPVIVSPESTYITEPLTAEGQVDYSAALLAKMREGVEPANNAAIPFLHAMWPTGLSTADQSLICQELGMDPPTRAGFVTWEQSPQAGEFQHDSGDRKAPLTAASEAPWRRNDCPLLAAWLEDQASALDQLRQISQRSHFYFPSPTLLRENDALLCGQDYPHLLPTRDAALALSARAMLAIGEQRAVDAWNDIDVCFELSRVPSPHGHFVEQLIAHVILGIAERATLALVTSETCDQPLLKQIAERIAQLPTESRLRPSLQGCSTYQALQIAQRIGQSRDAAEITAALQIESRLISNYQWIPYDRNSMSTELNRCLELHREVYEIPDLAERYAAAKKNDAILDEQLRNIIVDAKKDSYDQKARGILVGRSLAPIVADPLLVSAIHEIDWQQRLRLLQVAIALEQYRRANHQYPASLEPLSEYLDEDALRDPFAEALYLYELRGEGYLLYSRFVNQQDDGGSDLSRGLYQGEFDDEHELPTYFDGDVVIRVPVRPSRFQFGS